MSFTYHAYLLAEFRFVGNDRSPVLYQFRVSSESNAQITNDWARGFYATILHMQSAENFGAARMLLRKQVQMLMPSVDPLVHW